MDKGSTSAALSMRLPRDWCKTLMCDECSSKVKNAPRGQGFAYSIKQAARGFLDAQPRRALWHSCCDFQKKTFYMSDDLEKDHKCFGHGNAFQWLKIVDPRCPNIDLNKFFLIIKDDRVSEINRPYFTKPWQPVQGYDVSWLGHKTCDFWNRNTSSERTGSLCLEDSHTLKIGYKTFTIRLKSLFLWSAGKRMKEGATL